MDNGLRDKRGLEGVRVPVFEGFVRRLQREGHFFEEGPDATRDRDDKRQVIVTQPLRRLRIGRVDA
ncbi:hypothetical protein QTL95_04555 [Rhizobium sp. S152]|uniref:hypothetical protein n=1 Tax=Rhizobium sp. S152 TaxID=3055038 RepID=UPI0025A94A80|nr:hypothetical protein [Rhizobium sp. S152]MDM9625157.1 hypothetical protein [Rhizobium sp. S152]